MNPYFSPVLATYTWYSTCIAVHMCLFFISITHLRIIVFSCLIYRCWLKSSTNFVWAFVGPVILIILVQVVHVYITVYIQHHNIQQLRMLVNVLC